MNEHQNSIYIAGNDVKKKGARWKKPSFFVLGRKEKSEEEIVIYLRPYLVYSFFCQSFPPATEIHESVLHNTYLIISLTHKFCTFFFHQQRTRAHKVGLLAHSGVDVKFYGESFGSKT
jgi:hypothetical protein